MSEFINNVSRRKETLKEALRQIHAGKPYEAVKQTFAQVLQEASAGEIAEIEEALIAEGLPVEDIQYLCDVHVAMFRASLDQQTPPQMLPGHPIYTFNTENELAALQLNESRQLLRRAQGDPSAERLASLTAALQKLAGFDCHYQRKENLLFPFLEKYAFTGPSSVMWGIHDDIRKAWKSMLKLLSAPDDSPAETIAAVAQQFTPMENAMREMFYKEEHILFTNALERLNDSDWRAIHAQEPDFGFAFVQRGTQWPPDEQPQEIQTAVEPVSHEDPNEKTLEMNAFPLTTGDLTLPQINLMLTHLPVDVTFVDENDTVRYFSETPTRIFKRTPAIIGRKVHNCHPPASVHKVVAIVEDFRSGRRDNAEFWIQMNGMFVHIQYFALRDADGNYRGTLEVSQELSHLRELQGEKRLLDD
ncbi:MAG: uncharacterized protein PWQ55_2594 [Chloroflexota bacterium]|nr:uncharacterized protein [Chloroflexota bacterium]